MPAKSGAKPAAKVAKPSAKAAKPAPKVSSEKPAKKAKADAPKPTKKSTQPKPAAKSKTASAAAAKKDEKVPVKTTAEKKKDKAAKKARFNNLFVKRPKRFGIGQDLPPKDRDLTRIVRWPVYIQRQRQKRVLYKRLKVPPAINQFNLTLDRHTKKEVFKFAGKYKPEDKVERKNRLTQIAQAKLDNKEAPHTPKRNSIKTGIQRVTRLIEQKRAKLVLIAHDVDPLELVLCLPALCRKQGVPYAIVKGKAALGRLVGFKTATSVAFTDINEEDKVAFEKLVESIKKVFNERFDELRKSWGGLKLSVKSKQKLAKRKLAEKILADKKKGKKDKKQVQEEEEDDE
jgi:large subunit ribosomal protein L7Ae